jgi:predicted ribosomally synthesized peptide with nif11-like leader
MTADGLTQFRDEVTKNPDLARRAAAAGNLDGVVSLAQAEGYDVDCDDVKLAADAHEQTLLAPSAPDPTAGTAVVVLAVAVVAT